MYKSVYGLRKEVLMDLLSIISQIEQQLKEQDAIYHNVAVKFGLSDTAMWVLYEAHISETPITQQELIKQCFFAKQTVNTAVASLVKKGHVVLKSVDGSGRQKQIFLTESGEKLAKATAEPLIEAECRAYSVIERDKLIEYLHMTEKLTAALREETEKIEGVSI